MKCERDEVFFSYVYWVCVNVSLLSLQWSYNFDIFGKLRYFEEVFIGRTYDFDYIRYKIIGKGAQLKILYISFEGVASLFVVTDYLTFIMKMAFYAYRLTREWIIWPQTRCVV